MSERDWQRDWEICQHYKTHIYDIDTDQDVLIEEFLAEAREALPYWLQRVEKLEEENYKLNNVIGMVREYKDVISSFMYVLHADWKNKKEHFHVLTSWLKNMEKTGIELGQALAALNEET